MRRIILLTLFAFLASTTHAPAQRRGGGMGAGAARGAAAPSFNRGAYGYGRGAYRAPYAPGYGYGYAPYAYGPGYGYGYGLGYADLDDYDYPPSYAAAPYPYPVDPTTIIVPPPPRNVAPPREVHPLVVDYSDKDWPAEAPTQAAAAAALPDFAIVLKNGTTLSATTVVATDNVLHYVDPDERHMQIAMSEVDRDATRKLNLAHNLNLHLPSP